MNRPELEQLLELAEHRDAVAERLERVRQLEAEVERDGAIERAIPGLVESLEVRSAAITEIARELERQWVAQGPLVTIWTRAAEQLQLAESTDVDPTPYRAEVAAGERRVEAARLATRDERERLAAERRLLEAALAQLPVESEPLVELRDDARPEALRRDALALIESGDEAVRLLEEERLHAAGRLAEARAALAELGSEDALERELADLNAQLPAVVELTGNVPPSMEQRLRRAGIEIAAGSRE